jgi:1,4-dihydroxy-2-naphthoate octaprenyltransferase
MHRIAAFIRLSRLYFLPMPGLTYLIGAAVAERELGFLEERLLFAGLGIELFVQLSVAYMNDYWDMPTDRINTRRTLLSGGSGELTTGVLPPVVAIVAAIICQVIAVILAAWVGLSAVSWLLLALAIGAAIFYTTPPLKLAWRGFGELTTATVAGLMVPLWAYSLQTGRVSSEIILLCLPLVLFVMSMFIGIAAPDYPADHQVGKRTLPVIVGEKRIAHLYAGILALAYFTSIILWPARVPDSVLIATALSLPLALWAWWGLYAPLSAHRQTLLLMVVRTALVPALIVVALNLGLRTN